MISSNPPVAESSPMHLTLFSNADVPVFVLVSVNIGFFQMLKYF